jgi:hypothetical protein
MARVTPTNAWEKLAFKTKRLAQHRWRVLEAAGFQEKLWNANGG